MPTGGARSVPSHLEGHGSGRHPASPGANAVATPSVNVVRRHPSGAVGAMLPDGRRRHFQHGPIDLVLDCDGTDTARDVAFDRAWDVFADLLPSLVAELPMLRQPVGADVTGPVARRMRAACLPHGRDGFVTPMAAVAGAVADHVLAALASVPAIERAYVNNGGDIALHLSPGTTYRTGIVFDYAMPALDGFAEIAAEAGVGGIATSGWRGRSHSLGIADSVTVLAATAAEADVAATLIANAINVDDPAVLRQPALAVDPDSDLGNREVTVDVGDLLPGSAAAALDAGAAAARSMQARGLVVSALLTLRDETRLIETISRLPESGRNGESS